MARFQYIILCISAATLICSCSKIETPVLIATVEVTGITDVSALSGGFIVYGEEAGYQDIGVVWSTSTDPTIENNSGRYSHTGKNIEFISNGNWWTSTEINDMNAVFRNLYHENAGISRSSTNKNSGFSVRCMKEIM